MNTTQRMTLMRKYSVCLAFSTVFVAAGCSPGQRASEMTSFSAQGNSAQTPELFTIPQDQMSHVQVVTVQPSKLTANAAADRRGCLQRFQNHAGDQPGGRTGEHAFWSCRAST